MTRERAKTLASKWSAGCACSLREGEAEEYHKMFYDILREKQYVKPETNADRIRAMRDEEMAIMFAMLKADLTRLDRPVRQFSGRDANDNYDWLKQPAEEE